MTRDPTRVVWFFGLALGWSWVALAVAWWSGATATEPPTSWLRFVAGIGPIVATAALLQHDASGADRSRFWLRVIDHDSVGGRWWAIVVVTAAGPGFAVWVVGGEPELGTTDVVGIAGVVAFALAASFAEEPGWRGYALDALRHRPWLAAVAISIVWAVWHLPLYAIEGTFQHDDVGFGTAFFWIIQAAFLPQTILMIWILEHTRPSILPAVVFHAMVNISGEVLDYTTNQQAIRLAVWVLLAVVVLIERDPRSRPLGRLARQARIPLRSRKASMR